MALVTSCRQGAVSDVAALQVVATSPDTPGTMFQEDGKLRYIEGVDNGDAPAHDGTYEAEKILTPREV